MDLAIARHNINLSRRELSLAISCAAGVRQPAGSREAFERAFAEYTSVPRVFALDSGRSALALGLEGMGLAAGDKVVLPEDCFYSLPLVVRQLGLSPVFARVHPQTYAIDPDALEASLDGARAVILIHPFGQMAKTDAIASICAKRDIALIEDPSQSTGAALAGQKAGSFGSFSVFSLVSGKNLQTFGGGLLAVSDEGLAQRISGRADTLPGPDSSATRGRMAKGLVDWALSSRPGFALLTYPLFRLLSEIKRDWLDGLFEEQPGERKKPHLLSEEQSAMGMAGLELLDVRNDRRRANAIRMLNALEGVDGLGLPAFDHQATNTFNAVAVRVADARSLAKKLLRRGIDTRMDYMDWYGPPERRPADRLYLPNHPEMRDADVDRVVELIRECLR